MDFSLLFDPEYLPIIVGTLVGFGLLAAVLLVPVYRFLERERKVAQEWTPEALAERMQDQEPPATHGTAPDGESVESAADDAEGAAG
ncbi:MAG: hypothetical protein ABEL97_05710 [Salinibacter sp.]